MPRNATAFGSFCGSGDGSIYIAVLRNTARHGGLCCADLNPVGYSRDENFRQETAQNYNCIQF
ncbi:MAG: hypothetical protein WC670_02720 [Pseudolabrys sp.]|jgi:hypothetical protein